MTYAHSAPDTDALLLAAFLEGDPVARDRFPRQYREPLLRMAAIIAQQTTPILCCLDAVEDVVQRAWEILLGLPPTSFDPALCRVPDFLSCLLERAARDVHNEYV